MPWPVPLPPAPGLGALDRQVAPGVAVGVRGAGLGAVALLPWPSPVVTAWLGAHLRTGAGWRANRRRSGLARVYRRPAHPL